MCFYKKNRIIEKVFNENNSRQSIVDYYIFSAIIPFTIKFCNTKKGGGDLIRLDFG